MTKPRTGDADVNTARGQVGSMQQPDAAGRDIAAEGQYLIAFVRGDHNFAKERIPNAPPVFALIIGTGLDQRSGAARFRTIVVLAVQMACQESCESANQADRRSSKCSSLRETTGGRSIRKKRSYRVRTEAAETGFDANVDGADQEKSQNSAGDLRTSRPALYPDTVRRLGSRSVARPFAGG